MYFQHKKVGSLLTIVETVICRPFYRIVMLVKCPALAMSLVGQTFLFTEQPQLISAVVHEIDTFFTRHDC